MKRRVRLFVAIAVAAVAAPTTGAAGQVGSSPAAGSAIPPLYKNCTALNKKYPHGVGRAKARDKTSGKPVTTFKRSTAIYNTAMSYNKRLDGDKDGVACEKA
jgi:hypothetical protein